MYASGSKSCTSPAIWVSRSFASNRVIGPMPLFPAFRPAQDFSTEAPRGVIMPRPVTTTRRCSPFTDAEFTGRAAVTDPPTIGAVDEVSPLLAAVYRGDP